MLNELERFLQYFVHVHWPEQWFCRAGEPKQLIDQRVDPINLVQVELLRRLRGRNATPSLFDAFVVTVNGIAAGMRNTG